MNIQVKRFIAWHLGTEHMELGVSPPGRWIHRAGYVRRGTEHSCPRWASLSQHVCVITHPEALQTSPFGDLVWSLHHVGQMEFNIHHQMSSPEEGGRADNSKLLIKACSFWWPPLIREPFRSPLEQKKHLLSRKLQRFQDLCVRNQGKRLNIGIKNVSNAVIT